MALTQISRSLRFNSADSAYLNRTPGSAGNRRTWTWSGWLKQTLGNASWIFIFGNANSGNTQGFYCEIGSNNSLNIYDYNSAYVWQLTTTQVFRDPSAWYHFVIAVDTTQATSSNRVKVYVNGAQVTAFSTATYPTLNYESYWNNNIASSIGRSGAFNGNYFNGYQTEINFIDGQALTPSSFGFNSSDTGVWSPKQYIGSYGTNGFFLNFSDNSGTTSTTLGKDSSGNGNNWTPNNFSVTAGAGNDSMVDSPTSYGTDTGVGGEVRGNYCTLNPLQDSATLANGNLDATSLSNYSGRKATMQLPTTGKWYWETTVSNTSTTAGNWFLFGMVTNSFTLTSATAGAANAISFGDRNDSVSGVFNETSTVFQSASINFATSDILQCAYDADSGKFWFGKNNSWYDSSGTTTGAPATGSNQTLTAAAKDWFPFFQGNNTSSAANMNFGQRAFAYTAPSGFKALCTTNLPTPTIGATSTTQAGKYFGINLWTGNGSTGSRAITGLGFKPDWVWWKNRTTAKWHQVFDSNRGADKALSTNATDAEDASGGYGGEGSVTSFDSDGYTLQGGVGNNENGSAIVGWAWQAGQGTNSSNTAGTITSTVSANTTSGFSIVTYTGNGSSNQTVGHGLGVTPGMVIVKQRTAATGTVWRVWHTQLSGVDSYLGLNQTAAASTSSTVFNGFNSTTFTIGNDPSVNNNTGTFVAYCFAPVAGYSAFGSYTGNGSTDGPFVYTGFRPRYVLIKISSGSTGSWWIWDSGRNTFNAASNILAPDQSSAEISPYNCDLLSNGFKLRDITGALNGSGYTFIYAAFAEAPFKYALAR
jgi:hypothetical protein